MIISLCILAKAFRDIFTGKDLGLSMDILWPYIIPILLELEFIDKPIAELFK